MKRFLSNFRIYTDEKLEQIATNNERTFAYAMENLPSGLNLLYQNKCWVLLVQTFRKCAKT